LASNQIQQVQYHSIQIHSINAGQLVYGVISKEESNTLVVQGKVDSEVFALK